MNMEIKKEAALSGFAFPDDSNDFEDIISNGMVYIDKTSCLESLLNSGSMVPMILRPRKFGKTLFMSMLSCFLEMNYRHPEDRSRPERLFKDLAISKNKAFCNKYMGRYPVISLSFKDLDGETFQDAVKALIRIFAGLSDKFDFLTRRDDLDTVFLRRIRDLNTGKAPVFGSDGNFDGINNNLALDFLANLARCLNKACNKNPVIIIDDWDEPLQKAAARGYYPRMAAFIQSILSVTLKDNSDIFKGFLTGVHHIPCQSIYSGFNNYDKCDIFDTVYSDFIGFTKDETGDLLKRLSLENRIPDVIEWYGGYNFAGADMVCPWSVIKFLEQAFRPGNNPAAFPPENFLINSGAGDIIESSIRQSRGYNSDRIQELLEGNTAEIAHREFTSYPDISKVADFTTLAALMLHSGYLTAAKDVIPSDEYKTAVKIPNREVWDSFARKADFLFSSRNPEWAEMSQNLRDSLFNGDAEKVSEIMNTMLQDFISAQDFGSAFHKSFMIRALGITAGFSDNNLEADSGNGNGCFYLVIKNKGRGIAVIMNCKTGGSMRLSLRKQECLKALKEIAENGYDREIRKDYGTVREFGIVFGRKYCNVMGGSTSD